MWNLENVKKIILLGIAGITVTMLCNPSVLADSGGDLGGSSVILAEILDRVNNLPAFLTAAGSFIVSIMTDESKDKSEQALLPNFASIGSNLGTSNTTQNNLAATIIQNYFTTNAALKALPNVNDLSYLTLLNQLIVNPDPRNQAGSAPTVNPAQSYITNVAGMNITYPAPDINWAGTKRDKDAYNQYATTSMAAQTFNGYLMSQVYADLQAGFTTTQQALLAQASDSTWLATMGTEALGQVLRQTLLFTSQLYVLQLQSLQTQRQQLAAASLANTLIMANSLSNQSTLTIRASRKIPGG